MRSSQRRSSSHLRNSANREASPPDQGNGHRAPDRVFQRDMPAQAQPNQVRAPSPYRAPQPEIPAQAQPNQIRAPSPYRALQHDIPAQAEPNRFRVPSPYRALQPEIPAQAQPNQAQAGSPFRQFNPNPPREETIQEDARYVSRQVRTFLSMTRQLYRAANIICWTIIALFFMPLLIGFFFPSTRTYANPRISLGVSGANLPNSEPVWDLGFPLSTHYPFTLLVAFGLTVALYYAIDYLHDLLVKIARVSDAIQSGQFLR